MAEGLQDRQIAVALLGMGVVLFGIWNRRRLRTVPAWPVLWAALCMLVAGWTLAVLAEVLWPAVLNSLEHACYAASSVLMAVWCWMAFIGPREKARHVGRSG
jgi:hypothetical protein